VAQYDDLYLRSLVSDPGSIPKPGPQGRSPDIIAWGMYPQTAPQIFFAGNYNSDVGRSPVARAPNYIYVRAKNLGSTPANGVLSLYWSKAELISWTQTWNRLKTSANADSVEFREVGPGQIGVTSDPFIWIPPAAGLFALIARIATERHPNTIPSPSVDLSAWVAGNGGSGWCNVTASDTGAPTFTLQAAYEQGDQGWLITFIVECTNCGADGQSYIGFSSGTPLPGGAVANLVKTQITSESFAVGTRVHVPAGWRTTFVLSYWTKNPNPRMRINFLAVWTRDGQPRQTRQTQTLGTISAEDLAAGDSK